MEVYCNAPTFESRNQVLTYGYIEDGCIAEAPAEPKSQNHIEEQGTRTLNLVLVCTN